MNEWRKATLGEVLGPKGYIRGPFGSALKRAELLSQGIPVYEQHHAIYGTREFRFFVGQDKYQELSRFTVQPNDLIVSCSGTLGRVSLIRDSDPVGIISQALLILRPDTTHIDPAFLFYILSSPAGFHSLVSVSTGSVQVNIAKRSIIERVEIDLPPLAEQRAISSILGALDNKIELNPRMNETLEAMARAIFKDWFVDFGPTRAKMAGRAPYLAPRIWALFPDQLDDDGKPENWKSEAVLMQANWINGAAYKNMYFVEPTLGLPVVKIAELKNGVTSQTKFTNTDLGERYRIKDGEILFSWSGNPDTSIDTFIWTGGPAWLNQHIFAVRENGHRKLAYVYAMLKWLNPVFAELARNKQTTGLGHVTKDDLGRLQVVVPPPSIELEFYRTVGPILDRLRAALFENRALATIRDALLPKLMSGEIRVKEAAKIAEAAI